MSNYELPPGLNSKIIKYCYAKMETVNSKFLADHNVRPNLFLEVLYDKAIQNMYTIGSYEITDEDLQQVFLYVKTVEQVTLDFIEGRNELIGVKDDDQLVFRVRKQITY